MELSWSTCQFVHEHGQWVLRFFLDKQGGITLDDCATISEHIGPDPGRDGCHQTALFAGGVVPGINRPLKKEADYQRFIGESVDVTLYAPLDGRRHFKGKLQSINAGRRGGRSGPQQSFALPLADVAKARLDPEIEI